MTEQDQGQTTLDDLDIIWMADGIPCFFADREDICDLVESFGFNIYYLLANEAKEVKSSTTSTGSSVNYNNNNKTATVTPVTQIVHTAKLFKVVNNFVGRSVSLANPSFDIEEFISVEEQCSYNMPAIPHILIDKLDQFFRLVDAQHGTESIVMLTYDLDKQGSDGWGILVPDQTNTSVHCNYDPDSIAQIKPDNVMIVGSVHSHPGMAAYASGTDHADQADFDGIHITFGWQKSVNNGATQYYIELQMAGSAYKLDPEDVFEDYIIDKAPDPEVVGWTDKVKKVSPPSTGGTVPLTPGEAYQTPRQPAISKTPDSTAVGTNHKNQYYINYPTHIIESVFSASGINVDSLIICEAYAGKDSKNYTCPGCFQTVPKYYVYANHCCDFCDIPLSEPDTHVDQVIYDMMDYCKDRQIDTDCALYLFTKDSTNNHLLMLLTPTTMDVYVKSQWDDIDDPSKSSTQDLTLCCSSLSRDCYCERQILPIDSMDFDEFLGTTNVYDDKSNCASCIHYYDTNCPKYAEAVVDYISNKNDRNRIHYENVITGFDCEFYQSYLNDHDLPKEYYAD